MELEVGEILFNLQEVFQIEHFIQCTCTVEVIHHAICSVQCLRHMHNLCTQRSHTGTTADPHHLLLGVEYRMEVSVRATHGYLITRFQGKDIRRSDTRHYIHEARALVFRLERRRGDTYRQHNAVAFGRIVGHRIGTDGFFVIAALQAQQTEFLPCRQILITDKALVDVLIIIHRIFRNLNLRIRTRNEIHVLAFGQCNDELFDERSHILVGDNLALPLFYAQYAFGNLDGHIAFHFHLATQTPVILYLLTAEVRSLRRQDFTPTFHYLAFALSAGTFTTASGGKEHTVYRQRIQQCRTGSYVQFLVAIDSQFYITRRHQEILGNQQDNNKQDDNHEEYSNAC